MDEKTSTAALPSTEEKLPTQNDFLTLLDELEGIQSSYETAGGDEARKLDDERFACRKRLLALFAAAQEATYPSLTRSSTAQAPVAYMRDMGGGPSFTTSPLMTDDGNWKPLYASPLSATPSTDAVAMYRTLADRHNAQVNLLFAGLKRIADMVPYIEDSIHGRRLRCVHCGHAWVVDKDKEHHDDDCAYVIAKTAIEGSDGGVNG